MSLSRGHCETSAPWESTAAASQALLAGLGVFPARDAAQLREPQHTKGSPDRLKSIISKFIRYSSPHSLYGVLFTLYLRALWSPRLPVSGRTDVIRSNVYYQHSLQTTYGMARGHSAELLTSASSRLPNQTQRTLLLLKTYKCVHAERCLCTWHLGAQSRCLIILVNCLHSIQ